MKATIEKYITQIQEGNIPVIHLREFAENYPFTYLENKKEILSKIIMNGYTYIVMDQKLYKVF